jgi:iron complex transport system ATP-binding protein
MTDHVRRAKPVSVHPDRNGPALELTGVTVLIRRVPLIEDIDWRVDYGQHWVLLGRNGAGKTTTLSVASAQRFPSQGTAVVLGHQMGKVDLRDLRTHIGLVSTKQRLPDEENHTAHTVVLTGHSGSVLPLWERYDQSVRDRAAKLLELVGCTELADRPVRVCSQGERARVRLARALMADPLLLLLDEPFAGLDMPAREDLLEALHNLMRAQPELATVTVTHHLEEIPVTATHALMLRKGRVHAAGTAEETITSQQLSACFGRELDVHRINGRWTAHAVR